MRGRIASIVGMAMLATAVGGLTLAAPNNPRALAQRGPDGAIPVDVEVALAVDVSYSMDPDEQALQREGYMAAVSSREFLQALRQGSHGRIAMTYFEWAGMHHQQIIVPWRLVDGPEAAEGFAADIGRARYTRASRTSISGYYEDCVIGGPGAFVIPIKERDQFKEAVRTKLVLEIADHTPAPRIVPVSSAAPRISCTIGEKLWQERWGN